MSTPAATKMLPESLPDGVIVKRHIALVADIADLAALNVVVELESSQRVRAEHFGGRNSGGVRQVGSVAVVHGHREGGVDVGVRAGDDDELARAVTERVEIAETIAVLSVARRSAQTPAPDG
jgi:hypothetical protein